MNNHPLFENVNESAWPSRISHAKALVAQSYNRHFRTVDVDEVIPDDVQVVWFSKTLGHWKGLFITLTSDTRYYEVTYNGNKDEVYVDTYNKVKNEVFPSGLSSHKYH